MSEETTEALAVEIWAWYQGELAGDEGLQERIEDWPEQAAHLRNVLRRHLTVDPDSDLYGEIGRIAVRRAGREMLSGLLMLKHRPNLSRFDIEKLIHHICLQEEKP